MKQKLLTLKEAAQDLGLTYGTVSQYVFYGKLAATKIGHHKMIDPAEIKRFMDKRKGDAE